MGHRARTTPFVILGGGVAASAAAFALRDAGYDAPILLISDEPALPYLRSPLSMGYLRGEIEWPDVLVRPAAAYRDGGIDLLLGARAQRLDTVRQVVEVRGHGPIQYERLLLATGAGEQQAPLPGALRVRSIRDADRLRAAARPGHHVIVVGAGRTGAEVATSLATIGLRVTMLERSDIPLSRLGPTAARWLVARARGMGIDVRTGADVIATDETRGRHLVRTAADVFEADVVVDARGRAPCTWLTGGPGIGLSGDAARAIAHPHDFGVGYDEETAAALGAAAARSMIGLPPAPLPLPHRTSELLGERVVAIGSAWEADETIDLASGARGLWLHGRAGRLVGVVATADAVDVETVADLIRQGTALSALPRRLVHNREW